MHLAEKHYRAAKREAVRRIRNMLKKKFRDSGFVQGKIGESTTLKIVALPATKKDRALEEKKDLMGRKWGRDVKGFEGLEEIIGFTKDGVISDCHMACVVTGYYTLSLQDLLKLEKFVIKHLTILE